LEGNLLCTAAWHFAEYGAADYHAWVSEMNGSNLVTISSIVKREKLTERVMIKRNYVYQFRKKLKY